MFLVLGFFLVVLVMLGSMLVLSIGLNEFEKKIGAMQAILAKRYARREREQSPAAKKTS